MDKSVYALQGICCICLHKLRYMIKKSKYLWKAAGGSSTDSHLTATVDRIAEVSDQST